MPRYIDRDIALSHPFANGQYDKENANEHFIFGYEGYKEWLEQLPTIEAEPVRHGQWLTFGSMHSCSICGETVLVPTTITGIPTYDYCPHCGAKMDKK